MTVASEGAATVSGMNGYRISGSLVSNEQELAVSSHFIAKGSRVYAFHGISTPADTPSYSASFDAVVNGFANLTDRSRLDVQPERIEVRAVDRNMLLSKALNEFGVPESRADELAIVNGLELHDSLDAGTRIKIIV